MIEENELTETKEIGVIVSEVEAESAPASESEHEETQKSGFDKRIDKVTTQKYEAFAERDAERQRADDAVKELEELRKTAAPAPALAPPSEDLKFEDEAEYNKQATEYQRNLTLGLINEQREADRATEQARIANDLAAEDQKQARLSIMRSAEELKIPIEEVDKSAGVLIQRGLTPVAIDIITSHEKSAALIDYLAKNPSVFDDVNSLTDPISLTRKLDSLQETALRRNISDAAEPTEVLKGGGASTPDTFEQRHPGVVIK